ncbi:MAG: type II toxin-antitoxin system RelE family toxin [Acidimicrobiales bacterium]
MTSSTKREFVLCSLVGRGDTRVSFRVVVARTAAGHLAERLPEAVAGACVEFILETLAQNPNRVGAPLRKSFDGK